MNTTILDPAASIDLPVLQAEADVLQALLNAFLESLRSSPLLVNGIRYADATRYLTAIGATTLIYEHFLTLKDEVRLIWPARRSFAKFAFLLNRYLVPAVIIGLLPVESGLTLHLYSNKTCRNYLLGSLVLGILSLGLAQLLVLLRVAELWERERQIVRTLAGFFALEFSITLIMMIVTIFHLESSIQFSPIVHMCVLTARTPFLTGVWVTPMIFELFVLGMTCLNALSRPREAHTKLTNALYRDGISFFVSIFVLRFLNLLLSIVAPVGLIFMGVAFVWCSITILLNRSLLRMQKREVVRKRDSYTFEDGRSTPFGLHPDSMFFDDEEIEVAPDVARDMGKEEIEMVSAWYPK